MLPLNKQLLCAYYSSQFVKKAWKLSDEVATSDTNQSVGDQNSSLTLQNHVSGSKVTFPTEYQRNGFSHSVDKRDETGKEKKIQENGYALYKRGQFLQKYITENILQNGYKSDPVTLGRGCRQGDPVSPYLFVIAAEISYEIIKILRD